MRAGLRFGQFWLGVALAAAPMAALAQQTTTPTQTPTTNTPATDAIGPRELQNFKLPGTVTRQADQPPTTASPPAPATRSDAPAAATRNTTNVARTAPPQPEQRAARRQEPISTPVTEAPAPQPSASVPSPALTAPQAPPPASFTPAPDTSSGTTNSGKSLPLWPWLLAAVVVGAGAAFLFRRNRAREAYAGDGEAEMFAPPPVAAPPTRGPPAALKPAPAAPEPPAVRAPAPTPPPQPAPAPRADQPQLANSGVVSARFRPWLEIGMAPVAWIIDNERVTLEFELELFNSGSTPARSIAVETRAFNAGPAQEQQIQSFLGNPGGPAERVQTIPPLERAVVPLQIAIPRDQLQVYDLGGQQVFVPLIAFNVLYSWSSGEGQTGASYLLGREVGGEKLGPFRFDSSLGVRRELGARPLPTNLRV